MGKIKLAIFASGNGSNAEAIINYFSNNLNVEITCIYSNNKNAFVLERAANHGIVSRTFIKQEFRDPSFLEALLFENYDFLILAGFMWLIPPSIVKSFKNKIINIHPALLPNYGGKGMYGGFVHEAVIRNGETESGVTIHFVNENYDEGDIIFQAKCEVLDSDDPESLAEKIHQLEHKHYPRIIGELCNKNS